DTSRTYPKFSVGVCYTSTRSHATRSTRGASGALPVGLNVLRAAKPLLLGEERGQRIEVLLVHAGDDAGHDRVLALAALVVLERLYQVVRVLAGEDRIVLGGGRGAVGAVARDAGLRGRRRRADDLAARLDRLALQIRGDVGAVLLAQARGLSMH